MAFLWYYNDSFGVGFAKNMCICDALDISGSGSGTGGTRYLHGWRDNQVSGRRSGHQHPDNARQLPRNSHDQGHGDPAGQQLIAGDEHALGI